MTGPRVLMITGEYPPMEGGVADFTAILSRTMADLSPDGSVELHVLTSERAGPARTEGDVTVHPLMRRWGWLALPRAVRDLVARFRLDVVNIQYQSAAYGL
ncbi:MAG: hypothetical protein H5T69_13525, partial [Chloroflexi bacterium]|nr:hypothetical protein [Chloroflexota bacterium]